MLRTCQVVASINRNVGGPAVTVPRLAEALAARGVDSSLLTLDYPELGPRTDARGVRVRTIRANALTRRWRGWSPAMRRAMASFAGGGLDIIHSHGLWMFPNLYARQAALQGGLPLVISPRGMVEEWSLRRGRGKKFLAWLLYERANLQAARLFHATSEDEAASLRSLGLRQPIAVIPNGIDLPDLSAIPPRAVLESKFPELAGRSWLLFLSRLHEKKGIDRLLDAWSGLAARYPGWHLVIAGADLDGYGEIVRRQCAALGLDSRVTFTGMLVGEAKACALGRSQLFVLPTHSENFGIVIAEALAHRCPVITTTGAPWKDLVTHRCGWWIDLDLPSLSIALQEALQLEPDERRAMGSRGRQLMEQQYSWSHIGEEMLACYRWVLDQGPEPRCIVTG